MARKSTPTLTEAELRLMTVIWGRDESTVAEVVDALPARGRPAYNTVLTTMRILERKGYLRRAKAGRAHVYHALVTRDQAQSQVVRHVVKSFFAGSPEELVLNVLKDEELSPEELDRLRRMIDESERG